MRPIAASQCVDDDMSAMSFRDAPGSCADKLLLRDDVTDLRAAASPIIIMYAVGTATAGDSGGNA